MAYLLAEQRDAETPGCFERYREYLERNRARFPASAYSLATSDWYFDPHDHRCPHDAWLESAHFSEPHAGERSEKRSLSLSVRLLGAYHDGHIELHYPHVTAYRLDASNVKVGHLDWRYDEFRIDEDGFLVHEIEWSGPAPIGRWRIVLVDTSIPATEWGRIDVASLLHRLGPDDGAPTVLALHHPPITTSTHPWMRLEGGDELVAALAARGDVRVVLSGHLHEAFNVVVGGVSYIGCSSSFYSIKHRNQEFILDNGHVGALVLSLNDDGGFTWQRLPDPNETSTVLGPFE